MNTEEQELLGRNIGIVRIGERPGRRERDHGRHHG